MKKTMNRKKKRKIILKWKLKKKKEFKKIITRNKN